MLGPASSYGAPPEPVRAASAPAAIPTHETMLSWSQHIDAVVEETPLVSLQAMHTQAREHTRTLLQLYVAVFLLALAVSLDSMSFNLYLNDACSEFGALSSIGTIMIVQQLVRAISKLPLAKVADLAGRVWTLAMVVALYALGYALMARASTFLHLAIGAIVQSLGATGVGVLQSIIIADTSSVQWRGFLIGLVNLPYLLNFALAGPWVDITLRAGGWRLGLALWTVIVPLAALPLLLLLIVGHRRAHRMRRKHAPPPRRARDVLCEMDVVGTLLLSVSLTLLLLPLSLHGPQALTDASQLVRYEVLIGLALLPLFLWWESYTSTPLLPRAAMHHFTVVALCIIAALDFAGFYLSWTYLAPFVQVLKDWDSARTAYFVTAQNVTSTITGVVVGCFMAYTRRLKRYLVVGYVVRLAGVALMLRYRSLGHTALALLTCQVLQGLGGGALALTTQVGAQVAVEPHEVPVITAFELLTTELGAALGSALASAAVTAALPRALQTYLPSMDTAQRLEIQGSLHATLAYPLGSPERTDIARAWVDVMRQLCLLSLLMQLPALVLTFLVPDVDLHGPTGESRLAAPHVLPPWRTMTTPTRRRTHARYP
ncbi:hypothetical protein MEQU1_000901 [Malassezia equina]|uniref:Major facilitator superfamily (MFS) profile domain-containing protein n=1 Tax=Malassezia equina TaxID=1381935 RepID=A0AAF0IXW3_9BASI|nr:hypothetical protein MEQU1_000901 [Malassezia equina]